MLYLYFRCLRYIRELLDILVKNMDTIIARENITEETENDKFQKVCQFASTVLSSNFMYKVLILLSNTCLYCNTLCVMSHVLPQMTNAC